MIQRMFVTLDTKKTNYKNVGKINHGDDLILELTVLSDGDMISFNDPMVDLLVKKSDGKMIRQNSGIEHIKPNKFVIEVGKDCVTSPGLTTNQLIINDNGRISTCMFYYTILNSLEEDIIQSISNVEVLEQLDEYVIEAHERMESINNDISKLEEFFGATSDTLVEAEMARNEAEQKRVQSEILRVNNENDRIEADNIRNQNDSIRNQNEVDRSSSELVREQRESERILNEEERRQNESERMIDESTRQQNENTRQSNESIRMSNETDRKTQENRRVTAETNRVNAETTRRNNENSRISNESERQKSIKEMKSLIEEINSSLDKKVGVIEDEIEEINSSLDNISNNINGFVNVKAFKNDNGTYVQGNGIEDDTTGVQRALDSGYNIIFPVDFKCRIAKTLYIKSNTVVNFNGATLLKDFDNYSLIENESGRTTYSDKNIEILNFKARNHNATARGGYLILNGVENLKISNIDIYSNVPYDEKNGTYAMFVSGKNVTINNIVIDNFEAGVWADGVHFGYIENLTMNNFNIRSGDDCISLYPYPKTWNNVGMNKVSKNIQIGNGILSSNIASIIRIGASSSVDDEDEAPNNMCYKDVLIHDIVCDDCGETGPSIYLSDKRQSANLSDKHDNITLRNIKLPKQATKDGIIRISGNPNYDESNNVNQYNYGTITLENIDGCSDNTGAFIYGGGVKELNLNNVNFTRYGQAFSFGSYQFKQMGKLNINGGKHIFSDSGNAMLVRDVKELNIINASLIGCGSEYSGIRLEPKNIESMDIIINNGVLRNFGRGLMYSGTNPINKFIVNNLICLDNVNYDISTSLTATTKKVNIVTDKE